MSYVNERRGGVEASFSPLTPIRTSFCLVLWHRHRDTGISAGWSLNPDWCSHLKLKVAPFYVACFWALASLWCNFCFRCSLPSWVRLVWNWPGSSRDCSVKLQIFGPYWKSLTHIRGEKWLCYLGVCVCVRAGQRAEKCWHGEDAEDVDCWRYACLNPGPRWQEGILGNLKTS